MKSIKLLYVMAAAAVMLTFSQCGQSASQNGSATAQGGTLSGVKMAYVEVDTLLARYNFCIDMNEAMVKKSENVRLTLNQKASDLQKQQEEFQTKYNNNAFLSQERAQSEYARIQKLSEDLQTLSDNLQNELAQEQEKNSNVLRDSINAFLRDYNKDKGFTLIFSNTGMDNLLYADEALNITEEVIAGLNARYSSPAK